MDTLSHHASSPHLPLITQTTVLTLTLTMAPTMTVALTLTMAPTLPRRLIQLFVTLNPQLVALVHLRLGFHFGFRPGLGFRLGSGSGAAPVWGII